MTSSIISLGTSLKKAYNDFYYGSNESEPLLNASLALDKHFSDLNLQSLIFEYAALDFRSLVNAEIKRILGSENWSYPLRSPKNRNFFEHFVSKVTFLELSSSNVSTDKILSIAKMMRRLTTLVFHKSFEGRHCQRLLSELPVSGIRCEGIESSFISEMVKAKPNLTHIQIRGTTILNNQFQGLFQNCKELVELSIEGNALNSESWRSFCQCLRNLPRLSNLSLTRFNRLPEESGHTFVSSLATLSTLRILDISDTRLENIDILQFVFFNSHSLEILRIERCYTDLKGLFFNAISGIRTLRELNVVGCYLSNHFYENVVELRNLTKLICGDLEIDSTINMGDEQPPKIFDDKLIAKARQENPGLQIVEIPSRYYFLEW